MNMYPSYGGSMSESLEERIRNSFADIDEERVLSLSSPEPELDQFLFPELAQVNSAMTFLLIYNRRLTMEQLLLH